MSVTLTGPAPLSPLGWCSICAAQFKSDAIDHQREAIEAADKAPARTTIRLAPPREPPAPAVAWGLTVLPTPPGSPAPGQPAIIPAPLCWTHLNAIKFTGSGLIAAPPGAVLLDGSHPRGGGPPG